MNGCTREKTGFVLAASLGLNLFLLGMFLGHGHGPFGGPPPGAKGPPGPQQMVEELVRQLPPEDGQKAHAIFAEQEKQLLSHPDEMRAAMGKVALALRADPVDPAALTAALEGVAALDKGVHETMSAMLMRAGTELSLMGRQKLAEMIERGPPHGKNGPPRPDRGGPDGPPPPR